MKSIGLNTLTLSVCASLLLTLAAIPSGQAADQKIPAYLDPAQADEDFHFQGEYHGYQLTQASSRSSEQIGLHVIAMGNGEFQATKYFGGLPGQGWFGGQRFLMSGTRSGDVLKLEGGRFDVVISHGKAALYAQDGRPAGELHRVQRVSPTMGAKPPQGAIVLFDGTSTEHFVNAKTTADNLLMAGTETVTPYGDFRLHAEFYLPYKPLGRGQDRGNSGFYLQSRYEVQVLDSFGLEGVENECGSLYRTKRPDVNMCLPPLQWQTYDIDFTSAKFDSDGNKISDMTITLYHNGYPVQNQARIPNKTGAGRPEGPDPLTTKIQDHANPVLFRNIWLIDKNDADAMAQPWLSLPLKAPPVPYRFASPPVQISPVGGVATVQFVCP